MKTRHHTSTEALRADSVREVVDGFPPLVWHHDGRIETCALPAFTRDAWCESAGGRQGGRLRHTDRADAVALLCEPFLDTEFTPEDAARTEEQLGRLGFAPAEVAEHRKRLSGPMLAYNAIHWEWAHLGVSDVCAALRDGDAFCQSVLNRAWTHQGAVPPRPVVGSDPAHELSEAFAAIAGDVAVAGWGARRDALRDEVLRAYAEGVGEDGGVRAFHTARHLAEAWAIGRASLARQRGDGETQRQLAWVVLYHDVVYRTPGSRSVHPRDNEGESARWCDRRMHEAGEPAGFRDAVVHAIRWSARHERSSATTPLLRAFFDADMGILGLGPSRYDGYVAAVSVEYAALGTEAFNRGRLAFLDTLAAQLDAGPYYFGLDPLHDRLARENVARERAARRATVA